MNDKQLELLIGKILFVTVALSLVIVTLGSVMYCMHHAHDIVNFSVKPHYVVMPTLSETWHKAWQGDAPSIILIGLIMVIFSQVLRVLLTALIFVKQRDWTFMFISLVVLLLMSYQLF